ncbi:LemA family protein [uncultured Marivirga sp.]|mgnify:CR=1 FL=1|uniref:LemA family protein n=1 Tax=uncultured Marivirga sp. TaxID=1123707 RepID=UPI0030EED5C5|tara:strand:- start:98496 stop:99053 length:558 start_codon:yes stop_codon:yes gene_type:complete
MLAIGIVAGVLLLIIILMYNSLVNKKNQVENSFSTIDAMLKKRYDLIPNLVNTVKAFMKHEKDLLSEITELRTKAVSGNLSDSEKIDVENRISGKMGGIMVAVENYPDLKSNSNFLQLQGAWTESEEQISAARRAYNSSVTDYNNAVQMIPTNILASMMNYKKKDWFEIPDNERKNISAKDLFKA